MFSKYDVYTTVQSMYCYPDTAKAAQWCVEHGLMNAKFRGRFAPDGSSPAYKTLNAYRQLAG